MTIITGDMHFSKIVHLLNGPPTILCDDNICVGAAILVNVVDSLLCTVHHLHAALQVTVLCPQGLHL